jgi:hypothetical protein
MGTDCTLYVMVKVCESISVPSWPVVDEQSGIMLAFKLGQQEVQVFGFMILQLIKRLDVPLTFWHRYLNGYSQPFAYDIIFARHLNFSTWFTKTFIIPGTKKD